MLNDWSALFGVVADLTTTLVSLFDLLASLTGVV